MTMIMATMVVTIARHAIFMTHECATIMKSDVYFYFNMLICVVRNQQLLGKLMINADIAD